MIKRRSNASEVGRSPFPKDEDLEKAAISLGLNLTPKILAGVQENLNLLETHFVKLVEYRSEL